MVRYLFYTIGDLTYQSPLVKRRFYQGILYSEKCNTLSRQTPTYKSIMKTGFTLRRLSHNHSYSTAMCSDLLSTVLILTKISTINAVSVDSKSCTPASIVQLVLHQLRQNLSSIILWASPLSNVIETGREMSITQAKFRPAPPPHKK